MLKAILLAAYAAHTTGATYLPPTRNGCGKFHHTGYNNDTATHTICSGVNSTTNQPIKRTYAVNVPQSYNEKRRKAWPLILDYHGSGGTSAQQYNNSQYFMYDAGQEYLVVYPQGLNSNWQSANYSDQQVAEGASDLQFTTDLIQHMREEYCIDDDRIYASGKSNGGGFVDLLACSDHGDEFAAFAMAAPALYSDTSKKSCSKKRAIINSHGDKDVTIPYHPTAPGRGGPLPDITKWVSWWGQRTCGPEAKPDLTHYLGGYNTTFYFCGKYENVVQHYQVFELGHCWPSGTSDNYDVFGYPDQSTRKCLDKSLDFTPLVLNFFDRWTLKNAPRN